MALNGRKHGRGTYVYPDGSKYEGYWFDNKFLYGRMIYSQGDAYIGYWLDDKADGNGTYLNSRGQKYVGSWKEDMQHGYGKETRRSDGTSYEGFYNQGVR